MNNCLSKHGNSLSQIGKLMENAEFRMFFDKHFDNWDEITIVVMCMKVYDIIDKYYEGKLLSDQIVEMIRKGIKDPKMRVIMVNQMSNFTKGIESGFSKLLSIKGVE